MRLAALALIAAAACWGQTPAAAHAPKVSPYRAFENKVDEQLATANRQKPIDVVGNTRCFYVKGIGAVLSAKVELFRTPTINPFQRAISNEQFLDVYRTKTQNLPLLRQTMRSALMAMAKEMDFVPQTEQLIFAVGLIYQPWEDTKDLPTQIVMHADRRSALTGDIKTEEQ